MASSVGLQVYSVREDMKKDFLGTLAEVAGMGYKGVEFYDYGGHAARDLKDTLAGLNLKPINSHVLIERLEKDADFEMEYALELGLKDMTVPYLAEDRRKNLEDYRQFAGILQKFGEQCNKKGLQLHYHNHYFEFEKFGDVCGMDIILDNTDAKSLMIELDTFWVQEMNIDPIEYMNHHSDRIRMIHLKDRYENANRFSELSPFAEIGNGIMDIQGIIRTSEKSGIQWLIVEQDRCRRPALESVKISADYLKKAGIM